MRKSTDGFVMKSRKHRGVIKKCGCKEDAGCWKCVWEKIEQEKYTTDKTAKPQVDIYTKNDKR